MGSKLEAAITIYKDSKKKHGDIQKWTDKQLVSVRDKMRQIARTNRGKWTLVFYETLQLVNKESLKRKLSQQTA